MDAMIQAVPAWLGMLGWVVVLAGFLLQRRAWVNQQARIQTHINGNQNQVSNTVNQAVPATAGGGESSLAMWGSWASIVGLVLTLMPLVKLWLVSSS